jgi:hypothetical protein
MPKTTRKHPVYIRVRRYPWSNSGPANTPTKTTRKACTLPIHEIVDAELLERRSRI